MTTAETLTGSTDQPIPDGISRGVAVSAVQGVASVVAIRLGITVEELAMLSPAITFVGFVLFAVFDRFLRGKVTNRAASPV